MENRTKETGLTQWERYRISNIKNGAVRRNIEFNLTDEYIKNIINCPCTYCGEIVSGGIDRIDSTKGYVIGNVVPCCKICNMMKNKYSIEFFKNHIKKVYKMFYNDD